CKESSEYLRPRIKPVVCEYLRYFADGLALAERIANGEKERIVEKRIDACIDPVMADAALLKICDKRRIAVEKLAKHAHLWIFSVDRRRPFRPKGARNMRQCVHSDRVKAGLRQPPETILN